MIVSHAISMLASLKMKLEAADVPHAEQVREKIVFLCLDL
jgi:hypothetical protein